MTHTMSDIMTIIADRRQRLDRAPFLRSLAASSSLDELRAFVPHLHFFVLGFQDVLRLAHERVEEPRLRAISGQHRAEDAGHDQWFVSDVHELECARDLVWVFGDEHQVTRDVTYALISESIHATDDRVRLVLPLVLEAAGSLFFPRVVTLLERAGYSGGLRYFARSHQEVEAGHDMFSEASQRELEAIPFDDSTFEEAVVVVHRCFDLCEQLAAHLERHRLTAAA